MTGRILRTNYRRTGGIADITAIGGAIPKSSYMGGAGTDLPYGGFIIFSYCGSWQACEDTTDMIHGSGPDGVSNAWVESTHAALSAFYGDGKMPDGHKFYPVGMDMYYYSDVDGPGGAAACLPFLKIVNVHNSDSLFIVSAFKMSAKAAAHSHASLSMADFKARVWGFIVSSP